MRRYKTIALAAVLLSALAFPAMAWGPWCGWGGPERGWKGERMPDGGYYGKGFSYYSPRQADLSVEQKERIGKIDEEFFKKTQSIRDELRRARLEMDIAMNSEKPDETRVWEIQKKISDLQDRFDRERIRHHLEIKKILPDARFRPAMDRPFMGRWGGWGPGRI